MMASGDERPADTGYSDDAAIFVIADDDDRRRDALAAIAAANGRIVGQSDFAGAADAIAARGSIDLLMIEAADAGDGTADALVRIDAIARERDLDVVISMTEDQVDLVASRVFGGHAQLLCAPRIADRVSALATTRRQTSHGLHDVARDDSTRLRLLNEEVARIAEALSRLAYAPAGDAPRPVALREPPLTFRPQEDGRGQPPVDPVQIRNLIRARRMRGNHFPAELFADPAWDMLLDLFAAELEHRRVSVSSLCIAAAVPGTTALRWIGTMVDAGLFERHADQLDRRRAYVGLSDRARAGMTQYFAALRQSGLYPA